MNRNEIIDKVKNAGVVGAGGAGFPTHIKINSNADVVIANGAECEPLLHTDKELMIHCTDKIIKGLELVMIATGAKKGIIAFKGKYHEVESAFKKKLHNPNISLFLLKNVYPSGDEFDLVYNVTKRVVPEGGIPIDVGVVVDNVGTLVNIADAIDGIPVTERSLTIAGAVKNPISVKVPIGTLVKDLINLAGGTVCSDYQVIEGGPLMGKLVPSLEHPISKTTTGLIILPLNHPLINRYKRDFRTSAKRTQSVCDQCTICTEVCPRRLLGHRIYPHKIMRDINYNKIDSLSGALLCSECGVCEFFCPTGLSPCQINGHIKKEFAKKGITYKLFLSNPEMKESISLKWKPCREIPVDKFITRLGLEKYNLPAHFKETSFQPDKVVLPLKQHIGKSAIPTVKVGDYVKKGEVVADIKENIVSAKIHSSINGKILKITENEVVIG